MVRQHGAVARNGILHQRISNAPGIPEPLPTLHFPRGPIPDVAKSQIHPNVQAGRGHFDVVLGINFHENQGRLVSIKRDSTDGNSVSIRSLAAKHSAHEVTITESQVMTSDNVAANAIIRNSAANESDNTGERGRQLKAMTAANR